MSKLTIHTPFEKSLFLRHSLVRMQLELRSGWKASKRLGILGLIGLVWWLITRSEAEPFTPPFYFFVIFAGVGLVVTAILLRIQKRYKRKIDVLAEEYEELGMDCTYIFDQEMLKYEDKEKSYHLKWSAFKHYSLYKDYLLVFTDNRLQPFMLFEDRMDFHEHYEQILAFVKTKLPFKEMA
jgi:hypothetical protein